MENLEIINKLKALDLSTNPSQEVRNYIDKLAWHIVSVKLSSRKTVIMRARQNCKGERFTSKCDLTYPPKIKSVLNRANLPNESMFYASTWGKDKFPEPYLSTALESSKWFSDNTTKGIKIITFGIWQVIKDIKLAAIFHPEGDYNSNQNLKTIMTYFNNEISKLSTREQDDTMSIMDFFANQFAKKVLDGHEYEYLLSAIFMKFNIERGVDGVLYPSVQMKGEVLNVAISPEITDSSLELKEVKEFKIYKYLDHRILDREAGTDLYSNQTHFQLSPVQGWGQEECLRRLGLKSIDELTA